MVDFTKKGTKLPVLPTDTPIFINIGTEGYIVSTIFTDPQKNFISFGSIDIDGITYIFSEREGYTNGHYYKIALSYIEKLAREQGINFKPQQMIDFTKKGTKLPVIPKGLEYTFEYTFERKLKSKFFTYYKDFISFGCWTNENGDPCILAETYNYTGNKFYEIRVSDIERLAKEQGLVGHNIIKGYKCPMDLYDGNIKKDDIMNLSLRNGGHYKIEMRDGHYCQLPFELVESWEPVYEELEAHFELGSSKIKVHIGKGFIKADGAKFNIHQITKMLSPIGGGLNDLTKNSSKTYPIKLIEAKYKIGCSKFTLDDLRIIAEAYERINK